MGKMFLWITSVVVIMAFLTVVRTPIATAQPLTGAIFTTNMDSTFVNGNVYDFGEDVFLNGGPRPNAPCTAAGLPDGDYYFQITDPSGHTLLHEITDTIQFRKLRVTGGVIDLYYGGPRSTGQGKCQNPTGNITIQLFPFVSTPNPGGEYKVWMTRVSDYDPSMRGAFGFIQSKSKTDNFKVVPPDQPTEPCDIEPELCQPQ
jgi:hypothetical protein